MRLRDKLKTFYIHYHNTYGCQTTYPFYHVALLVVLISLIRFADLELKRLSCHGLFVVCHI